MYYIAVNTQAAGQSVDNFKTYNDFFWGRGVYGDATEDSLSFVHSDNGLETFKEEEGV